MSPSSSACLEQPELVLIHPTAAERPEREIDRRAHRRLRAAELSGIDHVQLKYGPIVSLIDLSAGGAQIETADHRLKPGAPLVVQIVGESGRLAVAAQVLRCHISALGEHPTYNGALEFSRHLELQQLLEPSLQHAIDRAESALDGGPWKLVSAPDFTAARAMIESVSNRRGTDFARPMGMLLRGAAPLFERGLSRPRAVEFVLRYVGKLIPGATIRLLDPAQFAVVISEDAFYLDVPGAAGAPQRKLLVEFVRRGRLEAGHLDLLRLAAYLVALADDIESGGVPPASLPPDRSEPTFSSSPSAPPQTKPASTRVEEGPASSPIEDKSVSPPLEIKPPSPALEAAPASPAPEAQSAPAPPQGKVRKLIVRYRDGRLLKGYCRGFMPGTGHVHIYAAPDGPVSSRITVPLSHLKALFFVHELEGLEGRAVPPVQVESKPRIDKLRGRTVTVTFLDGEALAGTTMTYSAEGPGFFVLPLDEGSNNQQIFVVTGAVRHMQFA